MRKFGVVAASTMVMTALLTAQDAGAAGKPRWVLHVERYSGGISNGVRFSLDPEVIRAKQALSRSLTRAGTRAITGRRNVQMNDDSFPQVPQNEESVAYSTDDPMIAVAAANDYVSGGVVVMRTRDGGQHWKSTRVVPQFAPNRDFCTGGDPAIAYSKRDRAFYLSQLCFFRAADPSELHVFKSVDNGVTWTPGRFAAVAASNYDPVAGTADPAFFNDKELITVDNNPGSPHYGRLYMAYVRFHLQPSGFSDSCPIQLSYTDSIPTFNPSLAVWTQVSVVPDDFGGTGTGASANQFATPVVENNGDLDIAYILEDCNSSFDRGLRFQKSTDGGNTFLARPVRVNKPGQWADNPDRTDLLPNTAFRAPNTIGLAYSPATGTLAYVYANYLSGQGDGNIDVSLSRNGGLTWSDSQTISLGQLGNPARNNQFFPAVAATPKGKFVAVWLDRRQDPNNHDIGTFEAISADDGVTWDNRRISTETWDPDIGFFTTGSFIGDYSGMAAHDKVYYPVWTDGRNNNIENTGIGETDVFTDVQIVIPSVAAK